MAARDRLVELIGQDLLDRNIEFDPHVLAAMQNATPAQGDVFVENLQKHNLHELGKVAYDICLARARALAETKADQMIDGEGRVELTALLALFKRTAIP